MSQPTITVKEFTVSYAMPVRNGVGNTNHFVSQNFVISHEVSPEEAVLLVLQGSEQVTKSVVLAALARADLTEAEAKQLMESSKERHSRMRAVLARSLSSGTLSEG